jgi:probable F420-dependent oxidoreductase
MARPFRFGVQVSRLPAQGWRDFARRVESQGFATLFVPDHFGAQWEPVATLAAVAAATERLRVGSLVYGVDYRHPVVLAKAAATIQLLSAGRHEFGLGAGWMETDYREAGLPYDRPGLRIERLEEALQVIHGMWTQERTSFEGRHYRVQEVARAVDDLAPEDRPAVLVGGGGPKLLGVAGRHADIVGINPKIPEGRVTAETARDMGAEEVARKVARVREAAREAGRDPDAIELQSLVFVTALTDDPRPVREALARNTGMDVEDVARCPLYLTGPPSEVRDTLARRREEHGISYVVVQGGDADMLERFAAEVAAPLARA